MREERWVRRASWGLSAEGGEGKREWEEVSCDGCCFRFFSSCSPEMGISDVGGYSSSLHMADERGQGGREGRPVAVQGTAPTLRVRAGGERGVQS